MLLYCKFSLTDILAVHELFGDSIPAKLYTFLCIGLASFLHHQEALEEIYKATGHVHQTALYRSTLIAALKEFVKVSVPWEGDMTAYLQRATGIPPHVAELALMEEIKGMVSCLVPDLTVAFEEKLDDRQVNGTLSEARLNQVIDNSPRMQRIENLLLASNGAPTTAGQQEVRVQNTRYLYFMHGGVMRKVPANWKFPTCSIILAYEHWHCPDEVRKVSPLKSLKKHDVCFVKQGTRTLEEFSFLLGMIDTEARRIGIYNENMDWATAKNTFLACKAVLGIQPETPQGRKRQVEQVTWSSCLRLMTANKKKRPAGHGLTIT